MPLIDFADIDKDAMIDMIYFRDGQIYTQYNLYTAQPVNEESLCKQPTDTAYLAKKNIFATYPSNEPSVRNNFNEYILIQDIVI